MGEISNLDPVMSRTVSCNQVLPGKLENGEPGEVSIPDPIMHRTAQCNHVLPGKLEN